ncbi:MAG: DUF4102 domain-containing protein, partial [Rhodospirillaceae bacterium]|nr:DUF4102 domain-containing protein [Rhodospirillaceae bacterium]
MARASNKLSALLVSKIKEKGRFADGGGLYLQVSQSGGKSWILRYMLNGKAREMGLGSVADVSLADARKRAAEAREALSAGIDPLAKRTEERTQARLAEARALTFNACCDAYIEAHDAEWRNAKHRQQWRNTLATYAGSVFGGLPVAE